MQMTPSPANPELHEQEYEPGELKQVALAMQRWLFWLHSSMSISQRKVSQHHFALEKKINKHKPVQVTPFPEYPELQVQVNDPGLLWQAAFALQLFPPLHSSISNERKEEASSVLE